MMSQPMLRSALIFTMRVHLLNCPMHADEQDAAGEALAETFNEEQQKELAAKIGHLMNCVLAEEGSAQSVAVELSN